MNAQTGKWGGPTGHPQFAFYRGRRVFEVWLGQRWLCVSW